MRGLVFVSWVCMCVASLAQTVQTVGKIDFSLADGLDIERVADESLIRWPIVADWDASGRLVVAESGGVGWPIVKHNQRKLHKIVRLIDSDNDGRFDQRLVAAENLAFPEGVLCLGADILVAAPPVILKLTDADGDGVCERREVWFDGQTTTNCANDLHGPYLGPDGWIYWCKGAFGEQTHNLTDGSTMTSKASHVFRRRLEGGPIEPVVSGGMDNPVEVAFSREGESFFTSTFLVHPGNGRGDGTRDGIAHAVYGSVFGKDHYVIDGLRRTGELMPIMTHLGPAAPSGLVRLRAPRSLSMLFESREQVLVSAQFNLQRLVAHELIATGASFSTKNVPLVIGDRVDFHPTDVIEDADGSLLLVDTGGWYDLCCPSSRIDQKTAAGGIYRITSKHPGDRLPRDRYVAARRTIDELVVDISDPRPWVRRHASLQIKELGDRSIKSLLEIVNDQGGLQRSVDALWCLGQIGTEAALQGVRSQLYGRRESLIHIACHLASVHRDRLAATPLTSLLTHANPAIRRVAAEALGRVGTAGSTADLLSMAENLAGDRHLEHSLIFALIEIGQREPAFEILSLATTPARLRVSLLVLEQLGRQSDATTDLLIGGLGSEDPQLQAIVARFLARDIQHVPALMGQLESLFDTDSGQSILSTLLVGWNSDDQVQDLMARWLSQGPALKRSQQRFLATDLVDIAPKPFPAEWIEPTFNWVSNATEAIRLPLIEHLSQIEVSDADTGTLTRAVLGLATDAKRSDERLAYLVMLPMMTELEDSELESLIVGTLTNNSPESATASKVLQRIVPSLSLISKLIDVIEEVPAQFLPNVIETISRANDDIADTRLLEALGELPAARTLPQDFLVQVYKARSDTLRKTAKQTAAKLLTPSQDIQRAVSSTLDSLPVGDPVQGLQVFRSNTAGCSGCHRIGYVGQDVGPNLTKIGRSRTRAALLEAIMFPSARLEQSYRSVLVLTFDGRTYNGLVRKRDGEGITLQISTDKTVILSFEDIEAIKPSDVSVMPSGMTQILSKQQIADLLALLKSNE